MLAAVSDLHFQQTRFDSLRYRDRHGRLMQLGVRRNVKPGAVARFLSRIDLAAKRLGSKQIHIVFAGDIFELHRTALWFMGAHARLRPTQDLGPDGAGLSKTVHAILDGLSDEHGETFDAIREGVRALRTGGRRVRVHYVPGNHDRLANAWASVRKKIRGLLGIPGGAKSFPVRLDFTGEEGLPDHGVRVRHGHEYDRTNMGRPVADGAALELSWDQHLLPTLGDFVTLDIAARLAVAFRILHARALRDPGPVGEEMRQLYVDLTEFDDVRPASKLEDYLVARTGTTRRRVFKRLQRTLGHVVAHVAADPWFKREIRKQAGLGALLLEPLQRLVRSAGPVGLSRIVRVGLELKERAGGSPAEVARLEPGLGERFDIVVGGHTHHPDQVPLGGSSFFLDTGTWRTDIREGVGGFGRLRAYTTVFCFDAAEREAGDGRRFETWTGHLAEGSAGPYDEIATDVTEDPVGERKLRFTKVEFHDVERERDGAEIELRYGVDGQGEKKVWKKVEKGAVRDFPVKEFELDPGLDGEVWCWGWEEDWPDPDDPLPVGTAFLERMKSSRQFKVQRGTVVLYGLNRTDATVHYEVVKA